MTTGLAESREVRSNIEWRLNNRVSVETSYDNVNDISSSALGNLGADVRWRLEFRVGLPDRGCSGACSRAQAARCARV